MNTPPLNDRWHKSSYSGGQTNCVEAAASVREAQIRDTKARDHGHLDLPTQAWQSLLNRL